MPYSAYLSATSAKAHGKCFSLKLLSSVSLAWRVSSVPKSCAKAARGAISTPLKGNPSGVWVDDDDGDEDDAEDEHDDNGKSTCQHIVTLTVQDESPSTSVRVEQVAEKRRDYDKGRATRENYETDKQKKPQAKQTRVGAFFMTDKMANNIVSLSAVVRAVAAVIAAISVVLSDISVFRIVLVSSEG